MKRKTKVIENTEARQPRKAAKPRKKSISIAPDVYEQIKQHAERHGLTVEQFVTRAIHKQLADEQRFRR